VKTGLRPRREWLLLVLLVLAGCGPGVGGTGTGELSSALSFFGAKPASVCSASFASQLKCQSRIVIGPTYVDPTAGTEADLWVDSADNGQVTVRINDSDVEFEAFCEGVRFSGTWGKRDDESIGRFYGYYTTSELIASRPGTLTAQTAAGNRLAYTLQDAKGIVVFGPQVFQKAAGEPAPVQCGLQLPGQSEEDSSDGRTSATQNDLIGRTRSSILPSLAQ